MGCGCNKPEAPSHTGPHEPARPADMVAPSNPSVTKAEKDAMLGKTQQFSLKDRQGNRIGGPYGSRLEAEADNVRKGYVGQVKPA